MVLVQVTLSLDTHQAWLDQVVSECTPFPDVVSYRDAHGAPGWWEPADPVWPERHRPHSQPGIKCPRPGWSLRGLRRADTPSSSQGRNVALRDWGLGDWGSGVRELGRAGGWLPYLDSLHFSLQHILHVLRELPHQLQAVYLLDLQTGSYILVFLFRAKRGCLHLIAHSLHVPSKCVRDVSPWSLS